MKASDFSQIRIYEVLPNLLRVTVKQNNFISGEIDLDNKIFYSAPRSKKNLMYLYSGSEGGLGINEEILLLKNYDTIKVKYNDQILSTSRLKWLAKGKSSKYCDMRVDKQIILSLSDINMQDVEKYEPKEKQEILFEEVI